MKPTLYVALSALLAVGAGLLVAHVMLRVRHGLRLRDVVVVALDEWRSRRLRAHLDREERRFRRAFDATRDPDERSRLLVARIRCHLEALGVDTSPFTDDDIRDGTMRLGELVAGFGVSADDVAKVMTTTLRQLAPRSGA